MFCLKCGGILSFWMHKEGFKGFGSFENDLYTGRSENSSEFFTEARDIWDRDENIFFHLQSKNMCSAPQILAKEMDYLHRVLFKNSYPDWIIKYPGKKQTTPPQNHDTGLEVNKNIFISVPYVPGLCEEFRRIF